MQSLRGRLLVAAAVTIALAMTASGIVLSRLFALHVEQRMAAELQTHLNQIVSKLEVGVDGKVSMLAPLSDPLFERPYSGLYWQIDERSGRRIRSRSLWDFELTFPDEIVAGTPHRHTIAGPGRTQLFAVELAVTLSALSPQQPVRIVVAIDRHEIEGAIGEFRSVLLRSLGVVALSLLAAFATMLHFGLKPFGALGASLRDVHAGIQPSVEGNYPSEVEALVVDVNRLLKRERDNLVRARERAADLAHGFKTPLAVLGAVSRDLSRDGRDNAAIEINMQVDVMNRHVKRELARAHAGGEAAVGAQSVAIVPVVEKVVKALRRMDDERSLDWTIDGAPEIKFAGDETDLLEIIGNLCENAVKWARTSIWITLAQTQGATTLTIEDDGPGMPAGAETLAVERGVRLDEQSEGHGLGLQIVSKLLETYGGSLRFAQSPRGGLAVSVTLPTERHGLRA